MRKLLAGLMLLVGSWQAVAYDCPPSNSKAGGYVPEFCAAAENDANSGRVLSVDSKQVDDASGVGAAVGAVAGGLLGNKVGGKKKKTLGTVLGAVAGGVAGHYGEKYLNKKTIWEVRVLMKGGQEKTFEYDTDPALKVGVEVFVSGGQAYKKIQ